MGLDSLGGNEWGVGGEVGVGVVRDVVVGRVLVGEIGGVVGLEIIEVNVGMGRNRILEWGFVGGGIWDGFGVRSGGKVLDGRERVDGGLVGLGGEDVGCLGEFIWGKWREEGMG